jgi:hypothetical protein
MIKMARINGIMQFAQKVTLLVHGENFTNLFFRGSCVLSYVFLHFCQGRLSLQRTNWLPQINSMNLEAKLKKKEEVLTIRCHFLNVQNQTPEIS